MPDTSWLGVKLNGIRIAHLTETEVQQPDGRWLPAGTASLDSAAWSYAARHGERLPGCTHVSPVTGLPSKCKTAPRSRQPGGGGCWARCAPSTRHARPDPSRQSRQALMLPLPLPLAGAPRHPRGPR